MHNMHRLGLVALLTVTFNVVGCDDGDDDSGTSDPTVATTPTTTSMDTDPTGDSEDGSSSSGEEVDCTNAPTHTAHIQPIWDDNCVAGCHEPGGTWQSMDLSPDVAYDFLVDFDGLQTMALPDVSIVVAGDTTNSYLLYKLRGDQADLAGEAVGGTQMPQEAAPLSDDEIALVEQWIACGAEM